MANVQPFRGLRYAPGVVPVERVVTQPYDKISREMQERYYASHPQNIVRIVLGKADPADSAQNNVYTRAAGFLQEWKKEAILVPIPISAFFVYFQKFSIPGTSDVRTRKGFIGLGRLEDYSNKVVFPHERTLSGPKQDRLQLLRSTRTHFEQIFMLYEDPARRIDEVMDRIAAGKPDIDVTDEYGVAHTLWIASSDEVRTLVRQEMANKKLIIADGHHRYETALAYRDEQRAGATPTPDAPYEFMPMTFFNIHSPGLTILPTHRLVSNLGQFDAAAMLDKAGQYFDVSPASPVAEKFRAELQAAGERRITIGICADAGRGNYLLGLKDASGSPLDVVVLHELLVERCLGINKDAVKKESNIAYVREFVAALEAVKEGKSQVSFLLNPTKLDQMRDIAYAGEVMPQKSTDFYPKVLSGLVMYSL